MADKASETNDHNTAIMIRAALLHHAICQLKLKPRKTKKYLISLKKCMVRFEIVINSICCDDERFDFQFYVPSLMVMHMHHKRLELSLLLEDVN